MTAEEIAEHGKHTWVAFNAFRVLGFASEEVFVEANPLELAVGVVRGGQRFFIGITATGTMEDASAIMGSFRAFCAKVTDTPDGPQCAEVTEAWNDGLDIFTTIFVGLMMKNMATPEMLASMSSRMGAQ